VLKPITENDAAKAIDWNDWTDWLIFSISMRDSLLSIDTEACFTGLYLSARCSLGTLEKNSSGTQTTSPSKQCLEGHGYVILFIMYYLTLLCLMSRWFLLRVLVGHCRCYRNLPNILSWTLSFVGSALHNCCIATSRKRLFGLYINVCTV